MILGGHSCCLRVGFDTSSTLGVAFLDFHLVSFISTLFHTFLLISTTSTLSYVDFSPPWDLEKAEVLYPCCFPPIMGTPSRHG